MNGIIEKIRAGLKRLGFKRRIEKLDLDRKDFQRRHNLTNRRVGIITAVAIALIVLLVWWFHNPKTAARGQAPLPVVAVAAVTGDIAITYTALGTVTPFASVTVQSQISGYLASVAFQEGQDVKVGDVLAQIDPRPYQAALDQAQGQLARDQAQLEGARIDLQRYATLVKQDSIAKQTYDDQVATVHQFEGTVQLDQGAVDTARLNLAYCRIVAPAAGRLGLRQVDAGNYVTPSLATGIVLINQMQPISVLFSLPEDDLLPILKRTHAGAILPAAAFDRSGVTKLEDGTLATVDNTISTTTGTFQLRASFANADEMLYPNQFVNIQLTVDVLKNAVVIPSSAIQRGSPGTFVYRVQADNTVAIAKVVLGPSQGESQAITSGLSVGDLVVTDGADKLKNGSKVSLPAAAPATVPAPTPTPTPTPATTPAPAPDQTPPAPAGDNTQPPADTAPIHLIPPNSAPVNLIPPNSGPVELVPPNPANPVNPAPTGPADNPPQHHHHHQNGQSDQNGQQGGGDGQ
jgi:multidrug efflux system membrane fusion protein